MELTPQYLAGFFDGEGCIDLQRCYPKERTGQLYVRPRLRIGLAASSKRILDALQGQFGGHLVHRVSRKKNQQDSWSLEWLGNSAILSVLDYIIPHLVLKREQALLVRWWMLNASGRSNQTGHSGMDQARQALVDHLHAMKRDPQRLSERAVEQIRSLMR